MASEKLKLFSKIELEILANTTCGLTILTDIPDQGMAQRFTISTPTRFNRGTFTTRIPYNVRGHLIQVFLTPVGNATVTLYRCRVWARELPGGQWQWYSIPVIETPVEFTPQDLPIPPTPEDWKPQELPIPPTPEQWRMVVLPVKPTPPVPDWLDLGVDK